MRVLISGLSLAMLLLGGEALAASRVCSQATGDLAAGTVTKQLRVLVDSTTVSCIAVREPEVDGRCGLICMSPNTMTLGQRTSILVWLVGSAGKAFNASGVSLFSTVNYIDKSLAQTGVALRASAAEVSRIQSLAINDRLTPTQIISESERAFSRVATKPR